jgi:hypothetical protein
MFVVPQLAKASGGTGFSHRLMFVIPQLAKASGGIGFIF